MDRVFRVNTYNVNSLAAYREEKTGSDGYSLERFKLAFENGFFIREDRVVVHFT